MQNSAEGEIFSADDTELRLDSSIRIQCWGKPLRIEHNVLHKHNTKFKRNHLNRRRSQN